MEPGDVLNGKYRIEKLLGQGGMGAVYLAENQDVGRKVAIKLLKAEYATDPETLARFKNEARAAGAIGHPGIVDVLDLGTTAEGAPFLVMERLQGETLRQRLASAPRISPQETVRLALEVLEALEAAHVAGVVHRDLKPDNLFLVTRPAGAVKVLDFGISKFRDGPGVNLTRTGQVMGTPLYMSPEQARGAKDVGPPTDLYSLGAILYEALCGSPPFPGQTYTEILSKLLIEPFPPLDSLRPGLPPGLVSVVERMLAKDPKARFASAAETATAMRVSMGLPPPPEPAPRNTAEVMAVGMTTPSARRDPLPPGMPSAGPGTGPSATPQVFQAVALASQPVIAATPLVPAAPTVPPAAPPARTFPMKWMLISLVPMALVGVGVGWIVGGTATPSGQASPAHPEHVAVTPPMPSPVPTLAAPQPVPVTPPAPQPRGEAKAPVAPPAPQPRVEAKVPVQPVESRPKAHSGPTPGAYATTDHFDGTATEQDSVFPFLPSTLTNRRWVQGVTMSDRGAQLVVSLDGTPPCVFRVQRSGGSFSVPLSQTCEVDHPGDSRTYRIANGSVSLTADRMSFALNGAITASTSSGNGLGTFSFTWVGAKSR